MVWQLKSLFSKCGPGDSRGATKAYVLPQTYQNTKHSVTGLTKQFLFKRPAGKAGAHSASLTTENQTPFNPGAADSFPQSSTSSSTSNPLGPSDSSINAAKRTRAS